MNNHPEFTLRTRTQTFVLIEDHAEHYQCMSVTNGAEEVVKRLTDSGILGDRRLFYVDTDGRVDELLHEHGLFTGFAAGYDNENLFWEEKRNEIK